MAFYLSENSKRNRSTAHPDLIAVSDLAITITPIDFGHGRLSAARTSDDQIQLFRRGHSKCDGFEKISDHQVKDDVHPDLPELSRALDFFGYVDGKVIWEGEPMAIVAAAFLQSASILGIKAGWGGLWPWDQPHIYLIEK